MQERFELIVEPPKTRGTGVAVLLSVAAHAAFLMLLFIPRPQPAPEKREQMVRFVEILKGAPEKQFTEAPGPEVDRAPLTAPYSDANRRASMPRPTGDQPTTRPGDGSLLYNPGDPRPPAPRAQRTTDAFSAQQQASPASDAERRNDRETDDTFAYRVPTNRASAASGTINWNSAIREVGKVASLGGGDGVGQSGGEQGYAESGPISFETQWYDWGPYAQQMVAKIRHHWYANMPTLIRLGVRGNVTIQFTIQRDGSITNVTVVSSSEIPPYDFAAKKAIELASPLLPLPADFPNRTERVTAGFFYNMNPPARR